MPDPNARWRILHTEIALDTPYLRLRRDRIETPRGDIVDDYYVRETRGFAIVFATTPDDDVVFVKQYKHGIATVVLELPAGAIEQNETPAAAALREFVEETGYQPAGPLEHVRTFITDPTNSNGRFHLFAGTGAVPTGRQDFDTTEDITVELIPLAHVRAAARKRIDVSHHVACIYTMLERLGLLN